VPCGAASALRGGGARWASRSRPCAAFLYEARCARRVCETDAQLPGLTRRTEPVTSPRQTLRSQTRPRLVGADTRQLFQDRDPSV
jgi:hypothetical protein